VQMEEVDHISLLGSGLHVLMALHKQLNMQVGCTLRRKPSCHTKQDNPQIVYVQSFFRTERPDVEALVHDRFEEPYTLKQSAGLSNGATAYRMEGSDMAFVDPITCLNLASSDHTLQLSLDRGYRRFETLLRFYDAVFH